MSQQINLLRDGLEIVELPWSARRAVLLVAAGLALVLAWALFAHLQQRALAAQLAALRGELDAEQAQMLEFGKALAARQPDPNLPQAIAQARLTLAGKRWVLDRLGQGSASAPARLSAYLEALGRQRIDGLWLQTILVADGGAELALRGLARDGALLPDYLKRLGGENAFAGREFGLFRLDPPDPEAGELRGHLQFSLATRCSAPALEPVCAVFSREAPR